MTKAERRNWIYNRYKCAVCTSLESFYRSCSEAKLAAEGIIKSKMIDDKGTRYRIVSGGWMYFTCAYCFFNSDTGKWYLRYFTRYSVTDYELTTEEVNELHLC